MSVITYYDGDTEYQISKAERLLRDAESMLMLRAPKHAEEIRQVRQKLREILIALEGVQ